MLYAGKRYTEPNTEIVVIPRQSGDIVFKAQAVLDFTNFEKLCPTPEPPVITFPGKAPAANPEHPDYKKALLQHERKRWDWLVLKSLEATPELQWEKVDLQNPDTWHLYREELRDAMFNVPEVNLIIGAVQKANSLDEDKLTEARKRFLASQGTASK